MKEKVNILIKGNLISKGSITPRKIVEGGGKSRAVISNLEEKYLEKYDISQSIIIDSDLIVEEFIYDGLVIVTGFTCCKKACNYVEQ